MRKIRNIRIIRLSTIELLGTYGTRVWKRRELVWNTDTDQKRLGDGANNWTGLEALGAPVALTVDLVATINVTIATGLNAGDSLNGGALTAGQKVLLTAQTAPEENGIYVVGPSPARLTGYTTYDAHAGLVIYSSALGHIYRCTSSSGGTLGTTALVFSRIGVGMLDFAKAGLPTGLQQATPAAGDIFPFIDVSDGNTWKYCTGAQIGALT
jgi:hypothetical protein